MRTIGYLFGRFPRSSVAFALALLPALGFYQNGNDFIVRLLLGWLAWYVIILLIGVVKKL